MLYLHFYKIFFIDPSFRLYPTYVHLYIYIVHTRIWVVYHITLLASVYWNTWEIRTPYSVQCKLWVWNCNSWIQDILSHEIRLFSYCCETSLTSMNHFCLRHHTAVTIPILSKWHKQRWWWIYRHNDTRRPCSAFQVLMKNVMNLNVLWYVRINNIMNSNKLF